MAPRLSQARFNTVSCCKVVLGMTLAGLFILGWVIGTKNEHS